MHRKQALLLTRNLRMIEESMMVQRIVDELEMGNS
jgi:hypothetical protein